MVQKPIQCCSEEPAYLVTYSVCDSEKEYLVCSVCVKLDCFLKYIVRKTPIQTVYGKKFQNEISDESVENEIIDVKFDELFEQNENLTEHNEKVSHSQLVLKNKGSEKL